MMTSPQHVLLFARVVVADDLYQRYATARYMLHSLRENYRDRAPDADTVIELARRSRECSDARTSYIAARAAVLAMLPEASEP